jgi:hypothetical protein
MASAFLSVHPDELDNHFEMEGSGKTRGTPSPATTMESHEVVIETAQDILLAAFREDVFRIDIREIFSPEQIRNLQAIEGEPITRGSGISARGGRGGSTTGFTGHSFTPGSGSGSGGGRHGHGHGRGGGVASSHPRAMRVQIKKKAESFDEAIRQQLVSELNKVSEMNYPIILKAIQSHYSRFAPESKEWVLQKIIENGTIQHSFAEVYMRLFKAIIDEHSKDGITLELTNKILNSLLDTHCDVLMEELSNGETYDDFCEANKVKLSRIGISKVIGEGINLGIVPITRIGEYTGKLLETLHKVWISSPECLPVATDNRVLCILSLFDVVGKTKAGKPGFIASMESIQSILTEEKTKKLLSSKARFSIMDLLDKYPVKSS